MFARAAWLTVELAHDALHAHYAATTDGYIEPGDLIRRAEKIKDTK